jgi:hypothetical protein
MTDFLTINGHPYLVQVQGSPAENAPDYTGSRERAFDNSLRSTRAHPKRVFAFVLGPVLADDFDTLIADTRGDQIVPIAGEFLNGAAAFNAMVDVTGDYVQDPVTFQRVAHVTINEV